MAASRYESAMMCMTHDTHDNFPGDRQVDSQPGTENEAGSDVQQNTPRRVPGRRTPKPKVDHLAGSELARLP